MQKRPRMLRALHGAQRLAVLVIACAFAGCAPSCSCEGTVPQAGPGSGSGPDRAAPRQAAKQPAKGSASGVAAHRDPNPPATPAEVFPDLETDTAKRDQLRERLARVQEAARSQPDKGKPGLAERSTLATVLPARLVDFSASGEATDGATLAGDQPVRVLARTYKDRERELYVKITDTQLAPFMRAPVLERLSAEGSPAEGYLHGRFVAGYPAIAQYYPDARNSQISALVGGRYVVEVRLFPAENAYEAQAVFATLPLAALAPPDEDASQQKKR